MKANSINKSFLFHSDGWMQANIVKRIGAGDGTVIKSLLLIEEKVKEENGQQQNKEPKT
jgi:hypothetical protein